MSNDVEGLPNPGTVMRIVYDAIVASRTYVYADHLAAQLGIKVNTCSSSCYDLTKRGVIKAKRKDREGRISTVFYVRDDQVAGVEGTLLPYEHRTFTPRAPRGRSSKPAESKPAAPNVLITIPVVTADGKHESFTVNFEDGRAVWQTLDSIYRR